MTIKHVLFVLIHFIISGALFGVAQNVHSVLLSTLLAVMAGGIFMAGVLAGFGYLAADRA